MKVSFYPSNKVYYAEKNEKLIDVASKANILIDGSCEGAGKCGRCKVKIISGLVSAPDDTERKLLSDKEIEEGFRLACRVSVLHDVSVYIDALDVDSRKTQLTKSVNNVVYSNEIAKYYIHPKAATIENQKSDEERIMFELPKTTCLINPDLLNNISEFVDLDVGLTVAIKKNEIISVEKGDTSKYLYGLAVDIGTTTVVGILWNLKDSKMIGIISKTNPQSVYGADVISRINYSSASPKLEIMKNAVRNCINEIIYEFEKTYRISKEYIYELTMVGNTTMSHLLLGINPLKLAKAPYTPVFISAVNVKAISLDIDVNNGAEALILPNIAGHVGSDIVGVILASRIYEKQGLNLIMDIGTNGEMVLARDGHMIACSTAAGPAFEGACIYQGMRAAPGAIEEFTIPDDTIHIKVIGNIKAIGICGSGLIDIVAQLLNAKLITASGNLISREEAVNNGISEALFNRLRKGPNGNEFIVYSSDTSEIVITQKDIREVQLAKGAIYSGILMMLKEFGVSVKDLDQIMIAGAFGNYIKKESAVRIGLLPNLAFNKMISIGNGAGIGASIALLSSKEREIASIQAKSVRHLELSGLKEFEDTFVNSMRFEQL